MADINIQYDPVEIETFKEKYKLLNITSAEYKILKLLEHRPLTIRRIIKAIQLLDQDEEPYSYYTIRNYIYALKEVGIIIEYPIKDGRNKIYGLAQHVSEKGMLYFIFRGQRGSLEDFLKGFLLHEKHTFTENFYRLPGILSHVYMRAYRKMHGLAEYDPKKEEPSELRPTVAETLEYLGRIKKYFEDFIALLNQIINTNFLWQGELKTPEAILGLFGELDPQTLEALEAEFQLDWQENALPVAPRNIINPIVPKKRGLEIKDLTDDEEESKVTE